MTIGDFHCACPPIRRDAPWNADSAFRQTDAGRSGQEYSSARLVGDLARAGTVVFWGDGPGCGLR